MFLLPPPSSPRTSYHHPLGGGLASRSTCICPLSNPFFTLKQQWSFQHTVCFALLAGWRQRLDVAYEVLCSLAPTYLSSLVSYHSLPQSACWTHWPSFSLPHLPGSFPSWVFPQDAPSTERSSLSLTCEFWVSIRSQDKGYFCYRVLTAPHISLPPSPCHSCNFTFVYVIIWVYLPTNLNSLRAHPCLFFLLTIYSQNPIQTLHMVHVQKIPLTNLISNN